VNKLKVKIGKRGAVDAMFIVTLAVAIMVGLYIMSSVYGSFVGDNASTTFSSNVETTINNTFTQATSGMTLMAVAIIVGAAALILAVLGGRL